MANWALSFWLPGSVAYLWGNGREEDGLRLATFYDLMIPRVYSGLSNNFAFSIGDKFESHPVS